MLHSEGELTARFLQFHILLLDLLLRANQFAYSHLFLVSCLHRLKYFILKSDQERKTASNYSFTNLINICHPLNESRDIWSKITKNNLSDFQRNESNSILTSWWFELLQRRITTFIVETMRAQHICRLQRFVVPLDNKENKRKYKGD